VAAKGRHRREGEAPAEDSEGVVVEAKSRGKVKKPPMPADKKGQNIRSLVRSMEATCVRDPEGLAEIKPIIEAAADVVDVVIATHMQRRRIGQGDAVPLKVFADILGVSEAAVSKRGKHGDAILQEREALAGTNRFAEAARDRARRDKEVAAARERMAGGGTGERTGTDG